MSSVPSQSRSDTFLLETSIAAVCVSLTIILDSAVPALIGVGMYSLQWGRWLLKGLIEEIQGPTVETPPGRET